MTVPAFSFTSRAVPIAEIGRPAPLDPNAITWVDIGCDVHQIVTDTGRGSASDRFVPGTAVIDASNVSDWAGGTVPLDWSYFADDFARIGPALGSRWQRWPVLEADHGADELVIVDEAAQVQGRRAPLADYTPSAPGCVLVDTAYGFGPVIAFAGIGPFAGVAVGDLAVVALAVQNERSVSPISLVGWERLVPSGIAYLAGLGWQYDVWTHRITEEEAAALGAGATWTATWELPAAWTWVGWVVRGAGELRLIGGNPTHHDDPSVYYYEAGVDFGFDGTPGAGCVSARVISGTGVHNFVEGGITELVHSTDWASTQLLAFDNGGTAMAAGTALAARRWNWTAAPTGDDWSVSATLLFVPGPYPVPPSVPMEGASCALWGQDFDGDQFVEVTVTGLAAPDKVWPDASTTIELLTHVNGLDLAAIVAVVEWVPAWDDPADTGRLSWSAVHRNTAGATDVALGSGFVDLGAEGFPVPARLRFEADAVGGFQLFFQDVLLGSGPNLDLTPLTGGHIGVFAAYFAGSLSFGRTHQPGPPRFEQIVGGSNLPVPVYLEPGVRVRVGVNHQVYGMHWLFHGYVDAIVPTYDPTRRATASIECIDALGEVGRREGVDGFGINPEEAWERVWRLLAEVAWPPALTDVADDATWMFNAASPPDRAIELLGQTAESCGGAFYGDPETGHVVFRARDWQAWDADDPPHGYITNGPHPSGVLALCPSTWERSWRRENMTTRITFTQTAAGEHGRPGAATETFFYSNPEAEARFGIEPYNRTLVAAEPRIYRKLGRRQLKLRGPGAFPRVNAVLLDAATGDSAVDVMTLSTFTLPSRYQCGLVIDGHTVFDRQYLVTGLRHTITRDRWQCRLELDLAEVFATKGARWGRGHWSRPGDVWGRSI